MIPLLLALFVALPILELWLLLQLGGLIGASWTLLVVIGTGVVGAWLARREGTRTMLEFRRQSQRGLLPGRALFDGMAIFVGGALLMTPGIITDLLGFSLLLPPSRDLIRGVVIAWLKKKLQSAQVIISESLRVDPDWAPPADRVYEQTFDHESDGGSGSNAQPDSVGRGPDRVHKK